MKKHIIVLAAALALAAPAAAAAPQTSPQATISKSCSSGYKHAVLGGEHKCLRVSQFCAKRHQRAYKRKGFVCKGGRLRYR